MPGVMFPGERNLQLAEFLDPAGYCPYSGA
jgi:hypothetical protein